jgi:hypothetical protein
MPPEFKDAIFELATRANDHLITAQSHFELSQKAEALPKAPFISLVIRSLSIHLGTHVIVFEATRSC